MGRYSLHRWDCIEHMHSPQCHGSEQQRDRQPHKFLKSLLRCFLGHKQYSQLKWGLYTLHKKDHRTSKKCFQNHSTHWKDRLSQVRLTDRALWECFFSKIGHKEFEVSDFALETLSYLKGRSSREVKHITCVNFLDHNIIAESLDISGGWIRSEWKSNSNPITSCYKHKTYSEVLNSLLLWWFEN